MAYHPQTQAFYIPLNLTCEKGTFRAVERVEGRRRHGRRQAHQRPSIRKRRASSASSWQWGEDGTVLWKQRVRTPYNTAALTTAGGLAFVGDWDRHFYAHDAQTGDAALADEDAGRRRRAFRSPTRYGDASIVAVPAGFGGGSWTSLIPIELTPEIKRPASGNSILVFALPEAARPSTARLQ